MKRAALIILSVFIFGAVIFNSSAFAFSRLDRPKEGKYFGYFLNETNCFCYIEIYIHDDGFFKLSPVREPHVSVNTEDRSASQAWLMLGKKYYMEAVLLNEFGDTLGKLYAIIELDESIKNPPTKEEQEQGITGWTWAVAFRYEEKIFSLEAGGVNAKRK